MRRTCLTTIAFALLAAVTAAALQAQNRGGGAILYSTDYMIEGLVYASSEFHWKGDGTGKKWFVAGREYTRNGLSICPCTSYRWGENERFIDDIVDAYEKAYPNLKVHNAEYPTP